MNTEQIPDEVLHTMSKTAMQELIERNEKHQWGLPKQVLVELLEKEKELFRVVVYNQYWLYQDGRVFGCRKQIFLKPRLDSNGYLSYSLSIDGVFKNKKIHRLLAEAFIPNPDNKKHINHKNGIKTDNRLENLEWCSPSENIQHAWDTGLKETNRKAVSASLKKRRSKQVIDTATGTIYNSIKEAAEAFKIDYGYLSQMIAGNNKNKTTLTYTKPLNNDQ